MNLLEVCVFKSSLLSEIWVCPLILIIAFLLLLPQTTAEATATAAAYFPQANPKAPREKHIP